MFGVPARMLFEPKFTMTPPTAGRSKRSPVMLPIPGTSRVAHLEENVAAAEIKLGDAEFASLDKAGCA
jgi:hypothetical protein